jgi:hypothetical protein
MTPTEKENQTEKLNKGAKKITDQLVKLLDQNQLSYREVSWKNGKDHYILTVKTACGTRFCRLAEISLLEEDLMTQQINTFLLSQLINKLKSLKKHAQE